MVAKTPSRAAFSIIPLLLAGAAAAPVQAQSYQQPVTVLGHPGEESALTRIVSYGDLALATRAGQSALLSRVGDAVGQVCPKADYAYSAYNIDYDAQDCVNFAWAGARPQIRRAIDLATSGQAVAMSIEITGAGR